MIGGILSTAVLGLTSAQALAQGMGLGPEAGFDVGGGGYTCVDLCEDLNALGFTNCDDSDFGFKFLGGFKFNQYFGAEAGYVDLGKVSATLLGVRVDVETDGFQFAAVGSYPIEQFPLPGKVGVYVWDLSASALGVTLGDDGSDIMFGIGGAFHFDSHLSLRGEWERFDIDGDDVDFFSASIIYNF